MNRRGFFGKLLPAAGVALGASSLSAESVIPKAHFKTLNEHPSSALERFNQEHTVGYDASELYRGYSVAFSGFIPAQETTRLVGQWRAWPDALRALVQNGRIYTPDPRAQAFARYFYAPVPWRPSSDDERGAWEYHPGEVFLMYHGVTIDDMWYQKNWPSLTEQVLDGRRRLIALLDSVL